MHIPGRCVNAHLRKLFASLIALSGGIWRGDAISFFRSTGASARLIVAAAGSNKHRITPTGGRVNFSANGYFRGCILGLVLLVTSSGADALTPIDQWTARQGTS